MNISKYFGSGSEEGSIQSVKVKIGIPIQVGKACFSLLRENEFTIDGEINSPFFKGEVKIELHAKDENEGIFSFNGKSDLAAKLFMGNENFRIEAQLDSIQNIFIFYPSGTKTYIEVTGPRNLTLILDTD